MAGLLVVQSQHTEKVPWPRDLHLHYEFSLQGPAADQCLIRTHAIVMVHPSKCSQQIRQQEKKNLISALLDLGPMGGFLHLTTPALASIFYLYVFKKPNQGNTYRGMSRF